MRVALGFAVFVTLEFLALYAIKYSRVHQRPALVPLAMLCYALIPLFIYWVLHYPGQKIATVNLQWNLLSTLYGLFIGMLLFRERLSPRQGYGVILGLLSLVLMFTGHDRRTH